MVKLNRIYTRTGDAGETGLGDGRRVPKNALRVMVMGSVDEANAAIGVARLETTGLDRPEPDAMLARIQNDLFDLGADFCMPAEAEEDGAKLRITPGQVTRLEREIDRLNGDLEPLRNPSCCRAAPPPRLISTLRAPSSGGPSAKAGRSRARSASASSSSATSTG